MQEKIMYALNYTLSDNAPETIVAAVAANENCIM